MLSLSETKYNFLLNALIVICFINSDSELLISFTGCFCGNLTENSLEFAKLNEYNHTITDSILALTQSYYIYPIDINETTLFIEEFWEGLVDFFPKDSFVNEITFQDIQRDTNRTILLDFEDRFSYFNDWERMAINITSGTKIGHQFRIDSANKIGDFINFTISDEIDENGDSVGSTDYLDVVLNTDSFDIVLDFDTPNFLDTGFFIPFFDTINSVKYKNK